MVVSCLGRIEHEDHGALNKSCTIRAFGSAGVGLYPKFISVKIAHCACLEKT